MGFVAVEDDILETVVAASSDDLPIDVEDPYKKEPSMCILCPRRYDADNCPKPDYRNPKLLSQFVSPHTGLIYDVHITGLCTGMQENVSREILRSQAAGFMSTLVKSRHYLQDPQLFNSSRPIRPNPY